MFKFLKDKLKSAVSSFTQKVEEEGEDVVVEEAVEEAPLEEVKVEEKEEEKIIEEKAAEEVKEEVVEEAAEEKEAAVEEEKTPPEEILVEEKVVDVVAEEPVEEKKVETKSSQKKEEKIIEEPVAAEEVAEDVKEEVIEEKKEEVVEEAPKKEGFFSRITKKITAKEITQEQFEELFWDLEVGLLENNVAFHVIEKIKEDLSGKLVGVALSRSKIMSTIQESLESTISSILIEPPNFMEKVESKKPYVICFVGINGSGKTTSIAKVTKLLQDSGLSVVLAAADTFRAAAIDQLEEHANKLGVKMIKHDYGSDPAAVAFDAIKHAKAKGVDVVLIDTAGRMHSNNNLLDEMKKIIRIAEPDMKLFVGESITGNDCVDQAKAFDEIVDLDGVILSKADVDEKGGAALSVSYITGKPIYFLGMGQEYTDLKVFSKDDILKQLF